MIIIIGTGGGGKMFVEHLEECQSQGKRGFRIHNLENQERHCVNDHCLL
jgi:hypothetical protein